MVCVRQNPFSFLMLGEYNSYSPLDVGVNKPTD